MIPKIIHYCWFGKGDKPKNFQRCLNSWKRFCPDYTIHEWNEETARPYYLPFVQDALRKKKYAFAADAIRTKVLYDLGGIYMDTDMLLLKNIDRLLEFDFFTGYEVEGRPAYGMFGAIPKHPLVAGMVSFYANERFNQFSPPVITHAFKNVVTPEHLGEADHIFAPKYFYAMPYEYKDDDYQGFISEESYAVHLWDHSWKQPKAANLWQLLYNLIVVFVDRYFFAYPKSYFNRYSKEFGRKLYRKIIKSQDS